MSVWGCPACCGDDDDCTCAASLPSDHQCDGEFSWCWPCEYRERLRDPSQTSTAVDDLPDASLLESSAPSAASGAGSLWSPSAAPTDSLPDPKGQEPA